MQLCKLTTLMATLLVMPVIANDVLTEQDLHNIHNSKTIIENASSTDAINEVVANSQLNESLVAELKQMEEHARKLDDNLRQSQRPLISVGVNEQNQTYSKIDFDQVNTIVENTPNAYQANLAQEIEPSAVVDLTTSSNFDDFVATDILQQPQKTMQPKKEQAEYDHDDTQSVLWIFVSSSMSDLQMKKALEIAAEQGGRVIYRGLRPKDRSINDLMRGITQLNAKLNKAQQDIRAQAERWEDLSTIDKAAVYLDPMAFKRFKVNEVPTMVYERRLADGTKFFGKVRGLISPVYLQNETEAALADPEHDTNLLNLGEMGQVYGIKERDWIEESKERIAAIDWLEKQREAINRHWQNRKFTVLPVSFTDREYLFDPTVRVTRDVKAKNGMILAKAGELLNPLKPVKGVDEVPLHTTMVVFDATDIHEVAFAKYIVENHSRGNVKLMASRIDKNRGFDHLTALNNYFVYPVTILRSDIVNRFGIEVTPTRLMSTDEGMMLISEYSKSTISMETPEDYLESARDIVAKPEELLDSTNTTEG